MYLVILVNFQPTPGHFTKDNWNVSSYFLQTWIMMYLFGYIAKVHIILTEQTGWFRCGG